MFFILYEVCNSIFYMFVLMYLYMYREVLECFRREELLEWALVESKYGPVLRDGTSDVTVTDVFTRGQEMGERRWENFRKRVIEHVSLG